MRQAAPFILVMLLIATAGAQVQRGPYANQLARECDALIQSAVRRPYGWGWDTVPTAAVGGSAPRHIAMEPPGSATAGVLLIWAGDLLSEPKYKQAALEAARGVAAAQIAAGKVPEHAIFGPNGAQSRDEPQVVPNRSATEAGLVLLLYAIDPQTKQPDLLMRGAQRAQQWLVKQQTDDGGWPIEYPPDAPAHQTSRILRLDDPDNRNATFTLFLAADMLRDPIVVKAAGKSATKLLSLRLSSVGAASTQPVDLPEQNEILSRAANLWTTAYRLNGSIDPSLKEFPTGADAIASRIAMQTLIGAYLMNGDKQAGQVLDSAARALNELRGPGATWQHLYRLEPTTEPAEQEQTSRVFGAPATQPSLTTGTFDLEPTLETISQLKLVGRTRYLSMLNEPLPMNQRLAAIICGLSDDPFTLQLPVTRAEADEYVKKHTADWQVLARPIPDDLAARLRRIWLLMLRTRIERMQS